MALEVTTDSLFNNWQCLLQSFKIDLETTRQTFVILATAYSSPERYYHNLEHINCVLKTIQLLANETDRLTDVRFAAWFHDVIYDSRANDNEEKSAQYARELLQSLSIPSDAIDRIARLILLTKHHQISANDRDGRVLLDADLAILGSDWDDYRQYARAIRQEYAWVPETQYIAERKRILERFLGRDRIYHTDLMSQERDRNAKNNLQTEIKLLLRGAS